MKKGETVIPQLAKEEQALLHNLTGLQQTLNTPIAPTEPHREAGFGEDKHLPPAIVPPTVTTNDATAKAIRPNIKRSNNKKTDIIDKGLNGKKGNRLPQLAKVGRSTTHNDRTAIDTQYTYHPTQPHREEKLGEEKHLQLLSFRPL